MRPLSPLGKDRRHEQTNAIFAETLPTFSVGYLLQQKADHYIYDPKDPIDVELFEILKGLSTEARNTLLLRRITPGRYEIDGRPCTVYREQHSRRLMVHENEVDGTDLSDASLLQYLQLAASVALESLQGTRAVTRPGVLTFDAPSDRKDVGDSERPTAMRLACVQAGVWEGEEPPPLVPATLGPAVAYSGSNRSAASTPGSPRLNSVPLGLGPAVVYAGSNKSAASHRSAASHQGSVRLAVGGFNAS